MNAPGRAKPKRTYLYDGVEAHFDGFHIVLEAQNESGTPARIYLEPRAMSALTEYADTVFKRVREEATEQS